MLPFAGIADPVWRGEGVHLQSDRAVYITGEYLHFNALLTDHEGVSRGGSGFVNLVLRNDQGAVHTSCHRVSGQAAAGAIYLHDTLATGYYELVAYTNWMRNSGEQHFASLLIFVANRFDRALDAIPQQGPDRDSQLTAYHKVSDASLRLQMSTATASRRQKQRLTLQALRQPEELLYLAVTVTQLETLTGPPGAAAGTMADLPPPVTSDDHGPRHFMEKESWILSGQLREAASGRPSGDVIVTLNTPDTFVNMLYVRSEEDGTFQLALPPAYHNRPLYLQALTDDTHQAVELSLHDRYALTSPFPATGFNAPAPARDEIHRSQDIVRARIAYGIRDVSEDRSLQRPLGKPVPLYASPLRTTVMAEYTPFDDLQEIAREIMPFWQVRRAGETYRSTLTCFHTRTSLPGSPVYFLDGIMVGDINPLIFLNSEMLERIEIHNTNWFYGELELPGIVALFSNAEAYQGVVPELPLLNTSFVVRDEGGIHTSPSHEKKEIRHDAPDLRQLLLWEPAIVMEGDAERVLTFYTGDLGGDFVVRAAGLTATGERVEAYAVIRVKR